MGSSESAWRILVVDDEEDVHLVTNLALKRREWHGRPLEIAHAYSAEEAKRLLLEDERGFEVAVVDVVMETRDAGLELCRFLRATCPHSLRIVLRTGQAGAAPKEVVLNEYDIDYYLAKPEVTADKLYTVIRACLRSSQDIATLLAFSRQLRSFTAALQNISARSDLLLFMGEGLKFLELKHSCAIQLVHDLDEPTPAEEPAAKLPFRASAEVLEAVRRLHASGVARDRDRLHRGEEYGLSPGTVLVPFEGPRDPETDDGGGVRGALFADFGAGAALQSHLDSFVADASFFIENWVIAYAALRLREHLARERMVREQMYLERVESIAQMVAGVAHEINTPLGVANTSNSLIRTMVRRVEAALPPEEREVVEDLQEACRLLERNIQRADNLVRSFRQLSASQLSDRRSRSNLVEVVNDCVASLSPDLRKQGIEVVRHVEDPDQLVWHGYPGHMSQVVINLIQNAAKYGFPNNQPGTIEIFFEALEPAAEGAERWLELRVRDHGAGIDESVRDRIFEPFVTTRGTGLGLAIVHNIVTNLLHGRISVDSAAGEGTTFVVAVPATIPEKDAGGGEEVGVSSESRPAGRF